MRGELEAVPDSNQQPAATAAAEEVFHSAAAVN